MATRKPKKIEPAETLVACENCRYFVPKDGRNECRRNPPTVAVDFEDGGVTSMFPLVDAGEWCGCWAAKLNS
ncbi:hypothetical protein [Cupriavidus taiwanensis]|uniref:hypothetical protein n=1 Tax=Cupriavidus taiwanensis TaxID=164546 RepID=UPI000E14B3C2|nr:hypothetical protein [Cupriavidus taiwanensis]SPA44589.1 hypothetical protein CBM2629_A150391 [Cupriavidus taiwanensis]